MQKFDIKSLNALMAKIFSPQSMTDMNKFLETLPLRAGHGVLIAGGLAWFIGGLGVVYATTVAKDVAEIRAELAKSEALKPVVAQLKRTPVPQKEISEYVEAVQKHYKDFNVSITSAGAGTIIISANEPNKFGAFREAINHAYNGGQRWRLSLESLCVGRECTGSFLNGTFKVNTLKIER